jgi:quercetin dioxygenase-like cupin family protein
MIFLNHDAIAVKMLHGLTRKTLAQSKSLMVCEFTFDANVTIPIHNHPHEQVGYVVEGRVIMTIAGQETELRKGDSYCALSNQPHGAYTLEPTVIIDTFSPPREDYQ